MVWALSYHMTMASEQHHKAMLTVIIYFAGTRNQGLILKVTRKFNRKEKTFELVIHGSSHSDFVRFQKIRVKCNISFLRFDSPFNMQPLIISDEVILHVIDDTKCYVIFCSTMVAQWICWTMSSMGLLWKFFSSSSFSWFSIAGFIIIFACLRKIALIFYDFFFTPRIYVLRKNFCTWSIVTSNLFMAMQSEELKFYALALARQQMIGGEIIGKTSDVIVVISGCLPYLIWLMWKLTFEKFGARTFIAW